MTLDLDPRLTLRQLEQFVAVADTGGFAPAAAQMHLTPNAVAQSVTELERILKVALTVRRRARGVSLTPSGVRFAERARTLLRQAGELVASVGEDDDGPLTGPVQLGCYETLAPLLLPRVWAEADRVHPGIDLGLQEGSADELTDALTRGQLDLALTYGLNLPAELESRALYSLAPKVSLASDHPLARRESVDLAELAEEPMILLGRFPSGENTLNLLRRRGIVPTVSHRVKDVELMRALVARGAGWALHFSAPGTPVSAEGVPVSTVPISPSDHRETVVVTWARSAPMPRRVRAIAALCAAELSDGTHSPT